MDFIKQQQELVKSKHPVDDFYGHHIISPEDLDTLITQIIKNTGEELLRRANEEKDPSPIDDTWDAYNAAIDTLKKHITSVTGLK